jgi:hypothetical protein
MIFVDANSIEIFIIVQQVPGQNAYRTAVVTKAGVPPFGPAFPANAVFSKTDDFRDFLVTLSTL